MSNIYTQIHLHLVFAVKNRQALINGMIRHRVEKYMTGIVQNFGHKLLAIYCMPDHAHLFVGFRPIQSIADFMRDVKADIFEFINREKLTKEKFNWQEGYGAFSYSHSHVHNVTDYVLNQPEHHCKKNIQRRIFRLVSQIRVSIRGKIFVYLDRNRCDSYGAALIFTICFLPRFSSYGAVKYRL